MRAHLRVTDRHIVTSKRVTDRHRVTEITLCLNIQLIAVKPLSAGDTCLERTRVFGFRTHTDCSNLRISPFIRTVLHVIGDNANYALVQRTHGRPLAESLV